MTGVYVRDDLHKTVSLPSRWARIVRRMSKDRWTPDELAPLIVRTVQMELMPNDDSNWRRLDDALKQADIDLFDDGREKMRLNLLQILDSQLPVGARNVCETALGVLEQTGMSSTYRGKVLQAAGMVHARDHIEQIASQVHAKHGQVQAQEALAHLSSALKQCDFSTWVQTTPRKIKGSIEDELSTEFNLML